MIYTELTEKAMKIAYTQHAGQNDLGELPYIFHPYHLAEQMGDDEYAICTALLHDVVEDTDMTTDDLEKAGFPDEVLIAVKHLTHDDKREYLGKYIEDIKADPLARKVKLADLRHNSDPTRLPPVENDAEKSLRSRRLEKYAKATAFLESD